MITNYFFCKSILIQQIFYSGSRVYHALTIINNNYRWQQQFDIELYIISNITTFLSYI